MSRRQTHRKLRGFLLSWRNVELITFAWLFLLLPLLTAGIWFLLPFAPGDFRKALALTFGLLLSVTIIARGMDWAKSGKEDDPAARNQTTCKGCGSTFPLSSGCLPILMYPALAAVVALGLRQLAKMYWHYEPHEGFLVFGWIGLSYLNFLIFRPFAGVGQCPKCGAELQA